MKRLFFRVIMAGLLLGGCAAGPSAVRQDTVDNEDEFTLARKLVNSMFSEYQRFTLRSFSEKVADDFTPLRSDFINNAAQNANAGDILEMKFSLEQVLPAKDLRAIAIKWQKRVQAVGASAVTLSEGKTELVFKNDGRKWRLYRITGDNPF